jgi:NitT/TauT family transport system substrate-binding protein
MKLSLATGHYLCYAPQYVASELGYYQAENLDVKFVDPPRPGLGLVDAVESGAADILIGTVWFSLMTAGSSAEMVMIGESNRHCHHALGSARPRPDFKWTEMPADLVILVPTDAPTPWVALANGLRAIGLSTASVRLIPGLSEQDCMNQLLAGIGDLAVLQLETIVVTDGLHEVATLSEIAGPIPWSVYCAEAASLDRLGDELSAFMRGFARGLEWLAAEPTNVVADLLARQFPSYSTNSISAAIDRYRALGLWTADGRIEVESVDRWGRMLLATGLLRQHVPAEGMIRDFARV